MDIKDLVQEVLVEDPITTLPEKTEKRLTVDSDDEDFKTDYRYSRENYYNLMEKGHDALDELLEIAKSTEHARHFEVASQLIKNLGETNEKLVNLQKVKKELTQEEDVGTGGWGVVGNIIWFVFAGFWLAIGHCAAAFLNAITIIGIPFAIQHLKLGGISLSPVGKTIVTKEVAAAARKKNAEEWGGWRKRERH